MPRKNGYHNVKWTPEALDRLRRLGPVTSEAALADIFGCTRGAVNSIKKLIGISGRREWGARAAISQYAEKYKVSRRAVINTGVERIPMMSEEARVIMLREWENQFHFDHRATTKTAHLRRRIVNPAQEDARVERMMQLTEIIARKAA